MTAEELLSWWETNGSWLDPYEIDPKIVEQTITELKELKRIRDWFAQPER